jgi:hypothetical protein
MGLAFSLIIKDFLRLLNSQKHLFDLILPLLHLLPLLDNVLFFLILLLLLPTTERNDWKKYLLYGGGIVAYSEQRKELSDLMQNICSRRIVVLTSNGGNGIDVIKEMLISHKKRKLNRNKINHRGLMIYFLDGIEEIHSQS